MIVEAELAGRHVIGPRRFGRDHLDVSLACIRIAHGHGAQLDQTPGQVRTAGIAKPVVLRWWPQPDLTLHAGRLANWCAAADDH